MILKLGYSLGGLGRAKVCALYKQGTEIPSDFQDVVFVSLDDEMWRLIRAKETKQVIDSVDLNNALSAR